MHFHAARCKHEREFWPDYLLDDYGMLGILAILHEVQYGVSFLSFRPYFTKLNAYVVYIEPDPNTPGSLYWENPKELYVTIKMLPVAIIQYFTVKPL